MQADPFLHHVLRLFIRCTHIELRPLLVVVSSMITANENLHALQGKLRSECYTPEVSASIEKDPWNFAAPGGESQHEVGRTIWLWLLGQCGP